MTKRSYVTTPIYYANGAPHIGTAYTSLIADIFARTKRILWYQVKFATGTDENGQKMKQSAAAEWKEVMEYLDHIAQIQQSTRDQLHISYTDFIRTTHPTHHAFVQQILEDALQKWHVYQWEYEGLYCVWCESFKKSTDLIEHEGNQVCPDHLKEPEKIKEKNWFFKLSEFQKTLEEFYKNHPSFSLPSHRYNEITSFVSQWLEDFSISREGSDFGIPLPDDFQDPNSVVYIWFDALYNYLTVCLHPQDFTKNWQSVSWEDNDMIFWNNESQPALSEVTHVIGKDISRFHAVYRPAMLMSSGYKLPDSEIINWFFTVDGQKMSKSLGNKIDPLELVQEYGRDALVYYLFSDIKIGNDGDFSRERFASTKENVLMKWWGNLVSRVVKLSSKNWISNIAITWKSLIKFLSKKVTDELEIPDQPVYDWALFHYLYKSLEWDTSIGDWINEKLENGDYMSYLRSWLSIVQLCNKYMQDHEPWIKIKNPETEMEAKEDLQLMLCMIKNLALIWSPFLIEWFVRVQEIVQIQHDDWKSFQTSENEDWLGDKFQKLLELTEFEVEFGDGYVY